MRINQLELLELETERGLSTYLILGTDDNVSGIAELGSQDPHGSAREILPAYLRGIASRLVLGSDPFETERLVHLLMNDESGRLSSVAAMAISLVEVACWDIVGHVLEVPVHRLFGGAVRERIKAFASRWAPADPAPDDLATAARRIVAKGYQALAFAPLGSGPGEVTREELRGAIRRCETVRAAVGPDVELLIELNDRLRPAGFPQMARGLERVEPSWIALSHRANEARARGSAGVRSSFRWPIVGGVHCHHRVDALEFLERRVCDVLELDLALGCGLLEIRKISAMAEAFGVPLILRNSGGALATSASLQLASVLPNFVMLESREDHVASRSGIPDSSMADGEDGRTSPLNGHFTRPLDPGIGHTLAPQRLRQIARSLVNQSLLPIPMQDEPRT